MAQASKPVGVVPYLVVSDAAGAIAFYEKAFGADELHRRTARGSSMPRWR